MRPVVKLLCRPVVVMLRGGGEEMLHQVRERLRFERFSQSGHALFEFDAVAGDVRGAGDEHLDADAGEGAAFGEAEGGDVGLKGLEFGRMTGPEGEGERHGALVFIFYGEDLAVLAGPKLSGMHFKDGEK
jgi:hypothetical protein